MDRILVIRGGAIGDFILTLPAIRLLRQAHPEAQLEILGYRHIIALAENRFYAQAVRSIEYGRLAGFFARNAELPPELPSYFDSFDLIVSYLFDPDGIFEANIRRCSEAEFLAAPAKPGEGAHASEQLARPIAAYLEQPVADPGARLYPTEEDRVFAVRLLESGRKPVIAIHPGSGSPQKNWPVANWEELLRALACEHPPSSFVVLGGEADRDVIRRLAPACADLSPRFVIDQPLTIVAGLLSLCDLFIGHDSGISHIAAAVGTPATLLFGPTDPKVWAPANSNARVLRAPDGDLASLSVQSVQEAIELQMTRRD